MTVRECLKKAYAETKTEDAVTDCDILMSYLLETERTSLFRKYYEILPKDTVSSLFDMVKRINSGEPVQYITGKAPFGELIFNVNEHVLIPRSDTEILYEEALSALKNIPSPLCLDLCTGSGCIALSLAYKLPDCGFFASDISPEALEVARLNADNHKLSHRINFILSDLFENLEDKKFDLVVSNPPYIPSEEIERLDKKVKDFEPRKALDGGTDGLDIYRKIIKAAPSHLKAGGILMMEMGIGEDGSLSELMSAEGFKKITVINDYGHIPRVIYGTCE